MKGDGNGKDKALETTLANLRKRYGDGAIMKLGEAADMRVEAIPTGALSLDLALGVGGLPRGRVTEIYGPESSGKTTICLHVIAEAQRLGGTCAFVDVEHALDPDYAGRIGVAVDDLYVSQPDTGEQALEIVHIVAAGMTSGLTVEKLANLEIAYPTYTAVLGLAARRALMELGRDLSGAQWRALGRTPTAPVAEWERRDGAA